MIRRPRPLNMDQKAKAEFAGKGEAASRLQPQAGAKPVLRNRIAPANLVLKKGGVAKKGKKK